MCSRTNLSSSSLDGPWGAYGVDWVHHWSKLLAHNDMVNAETGVFDPRHMFGMTGQDVFRWPALANGVQRQLLGFFITLLELPGIPMILYGEEQASYILENQADDYVFGRTPMTSQRAWQLHGCYHVGEAVYVDMPFNSSAYGCVDDSVSLDHRDPSHPVRNVLKRTFEIRRQYPVLNDGFSLLTLSNRTYDIFLPGSGGLPSPHGIWSVYRGRAEAAQDFAGNGASNLGAWLVYGNENRTVDYTFDCQSKNKSEVLISAFPANTVVKNLFYPYEEHTLEASTFKLGKLLLHDKVLVSHVSQGSKAQTSTMGVCLRWRWLRGITRHLCSRSNGRRRPRPSLGSSLVMMRG